MYVSINQMNKEKEYKIDPQYQIINRMIDTGNVNDIKASSLFYIYVEVLENDG